MVLKSGLGRRGVDADEAGGERHVRLRRYGSGPGVARRLLRDLRAAAICAQQAMELDASTSARREDFVVSSPGLSPRLGRGLLVCGRMAHIDSMVRLSRLSGKVPTE
jgi:hypothetical protein